jgi:predicted nucleic acid-binding protein
MLFDTDALVWVVRGHPGAVRVLAEDRPRAVSVISYMELLRGSLSQEDLRRIKSFLMEGFQTVSLSENIGHRAAVYVEEYGLKNGIEVADALIAATAVENGLMLCTANRKHYQPIRDLSMKVFRS